MTKILLSYRRFDSAAIAGRIFDRLVSRYGSDAVFMDVDNIPFGTDFREHIRETLLTSDLLVAILGPQWLGLRADGQSRIRDSADPVRIEIETALQARRPIVPVLIDGTEMPQPGDLPEALEKFCYLNAAVVASGRDFHHQVDRVIRSIDQILGPKTAPPAAAEPIPKRQGSRRSVLIAGGTALAATGAAVLGWWYRPSGSSTPPEARTTESRPTPPAAKAQPATSPPPEGPIRIGIGAPITGWGAMFGAQVKQGAEQAIADINDTGGILGRTLSASLGDDVSDPRQGVSVASNFAAAGVKFVIGHFNSAVTLSTSEIYHQNGVLMITPTSTNPLITERNLWNIFRTCGRDDRQAVVAADYIVGLFGNRIVGRLFRNKKIAIVHDKTTYGKGLADELQKALRARRIREVFFEGVNVGDKDFTALVARIRDAGVDLIYWGGLHTEAGLIVRQMRDLGVDTVLMGGDGIASDEFAIIGGPSVEGTLMTLAPDARKRPQAKVVVDKLRAKNFAPETYTLYSYAALQIITEAAEAANSLDPKKVAETMKSGRKFNTVIGELSYDQKGDVTRPDYVMHVWKKDSSGKIIYAEIDQ